MSSGRIRIPVKSGPPEGAAPTTGRADVDADAIARDLAKAVEGEVRFDAGSRALYATDASNFRQPPIGVVIPRTVDDIVRTHAICHRHSAPVLPRGCGTSLSGEAVNYAVVVDCSKHLHEILDIDTERAQVTVQPGAINEQVNIATGPHGLLFGPDPSTHRYCTIGGNIGNNSCGVHSIAARFAGNGSRTSDNVAGMEVLTYDGLRLRVGPTTDAELETIIAEGGRRGQIYRDLRGLRDRYAPLVRERFPKIPRRVSGYNLDALLPESGFDVAAALVGTEGTCVTVLEATLKLIPRPGARTLMAIGYHDIFSVADHLTEILDHRPIGCEAIDHLLFRNEQQLGIHPGNLRLLPDGRAWVLVEFGGDTKEEADARAEALADALRTDDHPPAGLSVFDDPHQESRLWEAREAGLGATAFGTDGTDHWPGWEDSAVAPEDVGRYLHDLRDLYAKYGYRGAFYGHLGDGCIHSRISFDLRSASGVRDYRAFLEEAADLVVGYGGSLSGEHGDGQQRGELLERMYGPELVQAFREFKAIWDPDWRMNPGKVVDPFPLDEDLKLGTDYDPWRPETRFAYTKDGGDFAHATLRCVGVGRCRIPDTDDVMCPSFQVLREEQHTTRGRARLLFEMLEGDLVDDGWRSEVVHEALDLCLACKGCTNDCPVNVDLPTYKAEFLHHHWRGRLRPRSAYAFGLIDQTARVASRMPRVANLMTHTPGIERLLKSAAGMAPQREIPRFTPLTLQRWFAQRGPRNAGGPRLVVWPDTFTNHFDSGNGIAAVETLEAGGWQVVIPQGHVCCGRPLYDYGFLDLATRYLRRVLAVLRDDVRAGVPVVGLEPSCVAVFKDELPGLLPHDDDARRLHDQAFHFADFLDAHSSRWPRFDDARRDGSRGDALVWAHCHHRATGDPQAEDRVLRALGYDVQVARGGCCGLAGSWGFEARHHDLSLAIGEEGLLPAVRDSAPSRLLVADGFSCRTQIQGATDRRASHLATVVRQALVP